MSKYQHLRDLLDENLTQRKLLKQLYLKKILHSLQNDEPFIGKNYLQFKIEHQGEPVIRDENFISWVTSEINFELNSTGVKVSGIFIDGTYKTRNIYVNLCLKNEQVSTP
jgi:hypothetical protein